MKNSISQADKEKWKKLGISNVIELALLIPHSYNNTHLDQSPNIGHFNTLHVKVLNTQYSPKALKIKFFSTLWDEALNGVVFHPKPFHSKLFAKGQEIYINGKIEENSYGLTIIQPQVITEINKLELKYKTVLQERSIKALMKKYLTKENLQNCGLSKEEIDVIQNVHFPTKTTPNVKNQKTLYVLKKLEIFNHLKKLRVKKWNKPSKIELKGDLTKFLKALPFTLTSDQLNAVEDIKADFLGANASKRVVMGDVGSGKTMIILASVCLAHPHKSVLLAPTTILAEQLHNEAQKHLPTHIKTTLITSKNSKKITPQELNQCDFIIGTHALLHIELPSFALVMVDEQHRFGVMQREQINQLSQCDGRYPHFIQLSATPIPRTLSMIQEELVDFSFIRQMPYAKNITTKVIRKSDFKDLKIHINKQTAQKKQTIIIYPLVNESEVIEYQSIDEAKGYWIKNFKNVYVTHGGDKDKDTILQNFRDNGNILIATTLVEVGISLPNLSTIVIVGAERMGLATLHQLRGRVSRTGGDGFCYLYTNRQKDERLDKFSSTLSGFDIAELDLKYRRSGDILDGKRQSGEKFVFYEYEEDILKEAKSKLLAQ